MKSLALLLGLGLAIGCGRPPETPATLRSLDAAAGSPAYGALARTAPTEMDAVRTDRQKAHEAAKAGDSITADMYAERALARYELAKLITERALADARVREAEPQLARTKQELAAVGQEQSMRDARIRELDLRLKVAGDVEARTPRSPADSAARQKARLEVAKSLAAEATLLCGAAKLLGGNADTQAASIPKTPDFEHAVSARLACLGVLESTRRASVSHSDALLEQISKTERFTVKRDERGVVVTLPATPAPADLEALGRTARGHALQVVVHDAAPGVATTSAQARGETVKKALVAAGADQSKLALELAGAALPVGDPAVPSLRAANERVEVVYVN